MICALLIAFLLSVCDGLMGGAACSVLLFLIFFLGVRDLEDSGLDCGRKTMDFISGVGRAEAEIYISRVMFCNAIFLLLFAFSVNFTGGLSGI